MLIYNFCRREKVFRKRKNMICKQNPAAQNLFIHLVKHYSGLIKKTWFHQNGWSLEKIGLNFDFWRILKLRNNYCHILCTQKNFITKQFFGSSKSLTLVQGKVGCTLYQSTPPPPEFLNHYASLSTQRYSWGEGSDMRGHFTKKWWFFPKN